MVNFLRDKKEVMARYEKFANLFNLLAVKVRNQSFIYRNE